MSTRREEKVFCILIPVTPETDLLTEGKSSTEKMSKQLAMEINNYVTKIWSTQLLLATTWKLQEPNYSSDITIL